MAVKGKALMYEPTALGSFPGPALLPGSWEQPLLFWSQTYLKKENVGRTSQALQRTTGGKTWFPTQNPWAIFSCPPPPVWQRCLANKLVCCCDKSPPGSRNDTVSPSPFPTSWSRLFKQYPELEDGSHDNSTNIYQPHKCNLFFLSAGYLFTVFLSCSCSFFISFCCCCYRLNIFVLFSTTELKYRHVVFGDLKSNCSCRAWIEVFFLFV